MRPARVFATFLLATLLGSGGAAWSEPGMVVIVHPNRTHPLSIEDLSRIYLRQMRFWADGTPIVPLNLPSGTSLRRAFASRVLRQSDARLARYWNRRYFDGMVPPSTLASSEAVRRYVASDRNAIGYLPASEVDESVRGVLHLD